MHRRLGHLLVSLLLIFSTLPALAAETADLVVVDKSDKRLYLYKNQKLLASFLVAFGANPQGHKQQEGDERTPEGRYVLDFKKSASGYYRSIHISYPNALDIANAKRRGVAPGGFVMIHGQRNGFGWASFLTQRFNWTNGCVALSNEDMEAVWQLAGVGTPIEIRP
jgi:murein L,D-transpeptidase YafK